MDVSNGKLEFIADASLTNHCSVMLNTDRICSLMVTRYIKKSETYLALICDAPVVYNYLTT